jgi:biotin transport system substrate-specific component
MAPDSGNQLRMTAYAALLAALTAVGAYIAIPIGPVPIVLQNFFVLLTGLLLGSRWGLASVAVYVLAGAVGLPVFAGGSGGIGRLVGPTGGYLVGYLPAVWVVGWVAERKGNQVLLDVVAMIGGMALVYLMGVSWLKIITGMTAAKAMAVGMYPFLPGDALKIAVAVPVARSLRSVVRVRSEGHLL